MRKAAFLLCLIALGLLGVPRMCYSADTTPETGKIRVLLVTGGHDYEKEPFNQMFKDNDAIVFTAAEHPKAHALLKGESAKSFDVLVLYDMWQNISEETKGDFLDFLKAGKGLVVLHHAIASYQKWPEYAKIIGARYYLQDTVVDGATKKPSFWQHDVKFKIKVAADHPVTRGLKDFEIHDEVYNGFDVTPGSQTLITTNERLSGPVLGWAKTYEAARVVYLQLGHDHFAYENPNYRQLVRQAIAWTASK